MLLSVCLFVFCFCQKYVLASGGVYQILSKDERALRELFHTLKKSTKRQSTVSERKVIVGTAKLWQLLSQDLDCFHVNHSG